MQSPSREVVFHVSIGKGSYVSLRAGKVKPQVRAKNLPCLARYFLPKPCPLWTLHKPAYVKRKRPTRRKTHKKKVGFTGNRKKVQ